MTNNTKIVASAPGKPPRRKSQLAQVGEMSDEFQADLETQADKLFNLQMSRMLPFDEYTPGQVEDNLNALVAIRVLMSPHDLIEEMLVVQMIGLQDVMTKSLQKAIVVDQHPQARERHLNAANKCSRTFVALVEALNRHRGKGQQKMTVEHVHVHAGGQAIVGSVESGGMVGTDAKSA